MRTYTLLSDVQRGTDDLRKEVADLLLDRVHHDQPVHAQFGSVQRTSREYRSPEGDVEVLATLEDAGIDREHVATVDSSEIDESLEVTELAPDDVYEIDDREYVRKAEADEERKETRLQGLKEQLASADDPEADELRDEIETFEDRIEELTEFSSGQKFHTPSGSNTERSVLGDPHLTSVHGKESTANLVDSKRCYTTVRIPPFPAERIVRCRAVSEHEHPRRVAPRFTEREVEGRGSAFFASGASEGS